MNSLQDNGRILTSHMINKISIQIKSDLQSCFVALLQQTPPHPALSSQWLQVYNFFFIMHICWQKVHLIKSTLGKRPCPSIISYLKRTNNFKKHLTTNGNRWWRNACKSLQVTSAVQYRVFTALYNVLTIYCPLTCKKIDAVLY